MDEFDFLPSDSEKVGTRINKNKVNDNNSDTLHSNLTNDTLQKSNYNITNDTPQKLNTLNYQDIKPTKTINMNNFVKTLEDNIDNFNFNKKTNNQTYIDDVDQIPQIESIKMIHSSNKQNNEQNKRTKFKYIDIMIYVLFFILLNNKFIIEIIYNKIPYMKTYESTYPNLILRSLIFGILVFIAKRFI